MENSKGKCCDKIIGKNPFGDENILCKNVKVNGKCPNPCHQPQAEECKHDWQNCEDNFSKHWEQCIKCNQKRECIKCKVSPKDLREEKPSSWEKEFEKKFGGVIMKICPENAPNSISEIRVVQDIKSFISNILDQAIEGEQESAFSRGYDLGSKTNIPVRKRLDEAIASERNRIAEEIEGVEKRTYQHKDNIHWNAYSEGYNRGLADCLDIIKNQ